MPLRPACVVGSDTGRWGEGERGRFPGGAPPGAGAFRKRNCGRSSADRMLPMQRAGSPWLLAQRLRVRAAGGRAWGLPNYAWSNSPGGAGAAAAFVLATQEFVANGGGRPSDRRRRSAGSPGGRAALAVSVSVAVGVPLQNSPSRRPRRVRLLLLGESDRPREPRLGSSRTTALSPMRS
jgi:hypothetical protein